MIYLSAILLMIVSLHFGCAERQASLVETGDDARTPTATPTPIREPLKDEYVNEKGWKLPASTKRKFISRKTTESATVSGQRVVIQKLNYSPADDLIEKEPFETLGLYDFVPIKISFITELSVNNWVFSYSIGFNRTKHSSDSERIIGIGPGAVFRYIDRDGDAIFETLVFTGKEGFIPEWVLNKE